MTQASGSAGPGPAVLDGTAASTTEAPVRVLRQFRIVNAVKAHFQQVEKLAGVGGAQLGALSAIAAEPGQGVTRLAQAMDVRQSTASNLVRGLVERELVAVACEGTDRRAVQLRLLPAGRRVLRRAPGPLEGVLPKALESLDAATLARLDADLARLIALLDADHHQSHVPLGSGRSLGGIS